MDGTWNSPRDVLTRFFAITSLAIATNFSRKSSARTRPAARAAAAAAPVCTNSLRFIIFFLPAGKAQ